MDSEPTELRLIWTREATNDLAEIYAYTLLTWGPTQAESYLSLILDEMMAVVHGNRTGRILPDWPEFSIIDVRWNKAKFSHRVVYRVAGGEIIEVITILHSRMDMTRRLARHREIKGDNT